VGHPSSPFVHLSSPFLPSIHPRECRGALHRPSCIMVSEAAQLNQVLCGIKSSPRRLASPSPKARRPRGPFCYSTFATTQPQHKTLEKTSTFHTDSVRDMTQMRAVVRGHTQNQRSLQPALLCMHPSGDVHVNVVHGAACKRLKALANNTDPDLVHALLVVLSNRLLRLAYHVFAVEVALLRGNSRPRQERRRRPFRGHQRVHRGSLRRGRSARLGLGVGGARRLARGRLGGQAPALGGCGCCGCCRVVPRCTTAIAVAAGGEHGHGRGTLPAIAGSVSS